MSLRSKIEGMKQIWQFDNRFHLLTIRLFYPNENLITYRYKGIEFLTDHLKGDTNGAREVLTTKMYRRYLPEMKFSNSINVLDIGSNNGGFALLLLSEKIQINKIVCVELNPNTFSRMRFNIERNFSCDFYPLNIAVCGENKLLKLKLSGGATSDSIYNEDTSEGTGYEIEGKTFDTLYEEVFGDAIVDVCKIDIEGAEFELFRSGNFEKLRNCRNLLMEIHHEQDRNREEIIQILIKANFVERFGEEKKDDKHHVHLFVNEGL